MPALEEHPSATSVKIVVAADSGAGKTGGLATLADAGYRLFILDFDNGVSTLRGYLKTPEGKKNVFYIPLADSFKLAGKVVGVAKADAFNKAMLALGNGTDEWGISMPKLADWGPKDILIVDTYSSMGRAALAMVMQLDGKGMGKPELQHYGQAMDNLERFLGMITSESVKCSVILNTHMQPLEGSTKIYPEALGSKLGPKVGRYFDNMITISTAGGRKQYCTQQDGMFACKTAVAMDAKYPLETGLLAIFEKLMKG